MLRALYNQSSPVGLLYVHQRSSSRSMINFNFNIIRSQSNFQFDLKNRLAPTDTFLKRHVGPNAHENAQMLKRLNLTSMEELIDETVPSEIQLTQPLDLGSLNEPLSESQALMTLEHMAGRNQVFKSFIGAGYHECITPSVIQRNILENPGWYTAYTPYQAEVSQGRLEMLLNFQTMVSDLTGLPIANASLLDEGTAAAEAMTLCFGNAKKKSTFVVAPESVHPQTLDIMKTRAKGLGIELVEDLGYCTDENLKHNICGVLVQYPSTCGSLTSVDLQEWSDKIQPHKKDCALVVASDLLALTKIKSPGEFGADVVIGSAQRFGVPMMYGGPHAGFMATSLTYQRKIPGRIIGISKDAQGQRALRMALQTREQHIRRDKATSNICTAQALLANVAAAYAVYHGPNGLTEIANRVHAWTCVFVAGFQILNLLDKAEAPKVLTSHFFDTVTVRVSDAAAVQARASSQYQCNVRVIDDTHVGVSFGETTCQWRHVVDLLGCFGLDTRMLSRSSSPFNESTDDGATTQVIQAQAWTDQIESVLETSIPKVYQRSSTFLRHPVFNSYHSETQMLRYLKALENKDLSLNTSMISLGSCTMKLNATSEMMPISWPAFCNLHPFAPADQALGYADLIQSLHQALAQITGFSAMSSQPNSGAQGEYAGLMCIRDYHTSQGQDQRKVCLIPMSAHGTNPASAVMAGMKVVVIKSTKKGEIDRQDLQDKVVKHSKELGAFMITYPSTYGVFEEGAAEMCDLIHKHGGQVYLDGANMNAQVGLCSPGSIGADVCHLNLHKTFCIPHGGGGPGVGTIGVAEHLAPFLPGHSVVPVAGEGTNTRMKSYGAISAAPYGSAGILPISWMYIAMLGSQGLRQVSTQAILNANYMATCLGEHYDVVFHGQKGRCAHEFIIDIRPFKPLGIVEEDLAKRLQDYGFHSPTMSWPVPGTLMIEPTESEDKEEMDRLVQAFVLIRKEIQFIADGHIKVEDSPLKHAPHTVAVISNSEWTRAYSREEAAFPAPWQLQGHRKSFWPSVGRVDNVHGDRHLVCTCPPMEDYLE